MYLKAHSTTLKLIGIVLFVLALVYYTFYVIYLWILACLHVFIVYYVSMYFRMFSCFNGAQCITLCKYIWNKEKFCLTRQKWIDTVLLKYSAEQQLKYTVEPNVL